MGPPVPVAFTGVDVDVAIGVFAVALDHVLTLERIVILWRVVGSKSVGIDSE